ncbi:hypothetical protein AVEN_57373-1 [Araneus ventricosus]|uniref:Uncharacterized protein n=1 Tax=Araneus ventricosus TaxID=182803 RepID=A0A4Y2S9C3_ARAVE|nr:hypothetical protein AVEN_57373-1 [Araneus ventricosus]
MAAASAFDCIEFFLEVIHEPGSHLKVNVASSGDEVPDYLKIHTIHVQDRLLRNPDTFHDYFNISPHLCRFSAIEWEGKIQRTSQTVQDLEGLKKILQKSSEVYGVWGTKQLDFFKPFLKKVLDISSEITKDVVRKKSDPRETATDGESKDSDPDACQLPMTTLQLFQHIVLRQNEPEGHYSMESEQEIQTYIEEVVWKSFMGYEGCFVKENA